MSGVVNGVVVVVVWCSLAWSTLRQGAGVGIVRNFVSSFAEASKTMRQDNSCYKKRSTGSPCSQRKNRRAGDIRNCSEYGVVNSLCSGFGDFFSNNQTVPGLGQARRGRLGGLVDGLQVVKNKHRRLDSESGRRATWHAGRDLRRGEGPTGVSLGHAIRGGDPYKMWI